MQPMSELPNDPVAKTEALGLKYGIEDGIKRNDFPVFDVVSDLPANRPLWVKNPNALFDYTVLGLKIGVERSFSFVILTEVVWRRGDD